MDLDAAKNVAKIVGKKIAKSSCDFLKNSYNSFDKINKKIESYNYYKSLLEYAIQENIDLTELCHFNEIDIDEKLQYKIYYLSKKEDTLFSELKNTTLGGCCSYLLYRLIRKFGIASTGTAISKLHGIAAKNAILAKIGLGTTASGGLGISGGLAILGIITLIPLTYSKIKKILKEEEEETCIFLKNSSREIIDTILEIEKINKEIKKILEM